MARNYDKEYKEYHASEEQKKRRAQRNKARRQAMERGSVSKGDSKEVDHLGANRKGSLGDRVKVISKTKNRKKQPKRDGSED
jgi:hypothetical protein